MSAAATLYQPFTWLSEAQQQAPHAHLLELLGKARDVAAGAAEITAIVERVEADAACGDEDGNPLPELLNPAICGHLQRLCVVSLGLLADRIDEAIQHDHAHPLRNAFTGLDALIPAAPCAGMMLTAEEAARLGALRLHLQAAGGAA